MAVLNQKQPEAATAIGKDRSPAPDASHAKAALVQINQRALSHDQKMIVIKKANAVLSGKGS